MFNFIPESIPSTIIIVGAGGTGSRLVPLLAQFMRSITLGKSPTGWVMDPRIILIDGDEVEEKNLIRQNFIARDVGQNKAVVLAQRYAKHFDINIQAIPDMVGSSSLGSLLSKYSLPGISGTLMWIMCVDSAKARRTILNLAWNSLPGTSHDYPTTSPVVIDAGNEDDFGQVRWFNLAGYRVTDGEAGEMSSYLPEFITIQGKTPIIPFPANYYRDLKDNVATASCADLDQTLAINAMMAVFIMGTIQCIYYRKPLAYNVVGVSLKGSTYYEWNTLARMIGEGYTTSQRGIQLWCGADPVSTYVNSNYDAKQAAERKAKAIRREAEKKAAREKWEAELAELAAKTEADRLAAEQGGTSIPEPSLADLMRQALESQPAVADIPPLIQVQPSPASPSITLAVPAGYTRGAEEAEENVNSDEDVEDGQD